MASYSPIPSAGWLSMFQTHWKQSKHFQIYNELGEEILWLFADPKLDPHEVDELGELSLLLHRPLQPLPKERFSCRITSGASLRALDDPSTYLASFGRDEISFDTSNPRPDLFFEPFEYGDPTFKNGTAVLYEGNFWKFIRWGPSQQVHIDRVGEGKQNFVRLCGNRSLQLWPTNGISPNLQLAAMSLPPPETSKHALPCRLRSQSL